MSDREKQRPSGRESAREESDRDLAGETLNPEATADQATQQSDPAGEVASLKERLEQVEKSLSEADLRARAEIQNVRKRAERDVEQAHKFALEKFAGDILAVADSLERALATLDPDNEAFKPAREGTELTLKMLLDVFARYGIEQVDPQGQAFNPELHEAMTMVPNPDLAPNTVVDVLEKGYTLNGRLLRPARVVVSKS